MILLPVAGALALLPPILTLFDQPLTLFGVPLSVVYIFSVWAALIVASVLIARKVGPDDD